MRGVRVASTPEYGSSIASARARAPSGRAAALRCRDRRPPAGPNAASKPPGDEATRAIPATAEPRARRARAPKARRRRRVRAYLVRVTAVALGEFDEFDVESLVELAVSTEAGLSASPITTAHRFIVPLVHEGQVVAATVAAKLHVAPMLNPGACATGQNQASRLDRLECGRCSSNLKFCVAQEIHRGRPQASTARRAREEQHAPAERERGGKKLPKRTRTHTRPRR